MKNEIKIKRFKIKAIFNIDNKLVKFKRNKKIEIVKYKRLLIRKFKKTKVLTLPEAIKNIGSINLVCF
ncbi:hypothetical protein [Polaribacter sp.]|uniref:hypothetical protein n=1 Tax=Polaribacter sp. TaxID=1920175 RepID=UPI00404855B0